MRNKDASCSYNNCRRHPWSHTNQKLTHSTSTQLYKLQSSEESHWHSSCSLKTASAK